MEVAGLVLGALPMAIQAFQTYRTILSSMRNTKRDLESMTRDLKTEVVILQNTCEMLLRGVASDSEIESMIEDPYGASWGKYEDQVRLRLWRSGASFKELAEDMMEATAELKEMLAINDQGKTRLTDRASVLTELKCKTSFTLRKDEYAKILTRLHNGNAALRVLVQQNNDLESSRRPRAQAKAARLIRRLSAGIFSALRDALRCSCIRSHDIGLAIPQGGPVMVPDDKEEDAARALDFDIVLGTHGENSQRWDRLRVKLAEKELISQAPISSPNCSRSPKGRARWAWSSLFIRSEKVELNSSSSKSPLDPSTKRVSNTISVRPPITNLCQILRKGKGVSPECYGSINSRSNSFDLFHQECPASFCTTITLREILEAREQSTVSFGYTDRLRLALTLSFGVLHLYSTPWLSKAVTLDDIVFLHGEDSTGHDIHYLDPPFLAKQLSEASQETLAAPLTSPRPHPVSQQQTSLAITHRPVDSTILSLGLLLIQIIIGNYSEQLSIEEGITMDIMLDKQISALKMAGLVLQNGGKNYAGAVQWCLENFLSVGNLDNTELARQFYEAVICRLETDMKIQSIETF